MSVNGPAVVLVLTRLGLRGGRLRDSLAAALLGLSVVAAPVVLVASGADRALPEGWIVLACVPALLIGHRFGAAVFRRLDDRRPPPARARGGGDRRAAEHHRRARLAWAAMATIEVLDADITKLEVDAIANAANTDLMHGGGVAGAISRAGGPAIQAESDALAPIGLGEAVATGAGELPCRWVVHAATMHLGGPTSAEIIREATASALRVADELGATLVRAGRLRHRRRRLPARRGGADRDRGGAPPPRRRQRARADRLLRPRRRAREAFESALGG